MQREEESQTFWFEITNLVTGSQRVWELQCQNGRHSLLIADKMMRHGNQHVNVLPFDPRTTDPAPEALEEINGTQYQGLDRDYEDEFRHPENHLNYFEKHGFEKVQFTPLSQDNWSPQLDELGEPVVITYYPDYQDLFI